MHHYCGGPIYGSVSGSTGEIAHQIVGCFIKIIRVCTTGDRALGSSRYWYEDLTAHNICDRLSRNGSSLFGNGCLFGCGRAPFYSLQNLVSPKAHDNCGILITLMTSEPWILCGAFEYPSAIMFDRRYRSQRRIAWTRIPNSLYCSHVLSKHHTIRKFTPRHYTNSPFELPAFLCHSVPHAGYWIERSTSAQQASWKTYSRKIVHNFVTREVAVNHISGGVRILVNRYFTNINIGLNNIDNIISWRWIRWRHWAGFLGTLLRHVVHNFG